MTDPIDAFLNLLGKRGNDIEIVAALDRLIDEVRQEAADEVRKASPISCTCDLAHLQGCPALRDKEGSE